MESQTSSRIPLTPVAAGGSAPAGAPAFIGQMPPLSPVPPVALTRRPRRPLRPPRRKPIGYLWRPWLTFVCVLLQVIPYSAVVDGHTNRSGTRDWFRAGDGDGHAREVTHQVWDAILPITVLSTAALLLSVTLWRYARWHRHEGRVQHWAAMVAFCLGLANAGLAVLSMTGAAITVMGTWFWAAG
jgi:hypothetical protein